MQSQTKPNVNPGLQPDPNANANIIPRLTLKPNPNPDNSIGDPGARDLAGALKGLKGLKTLWLDGTCVRSGHPDHTCIPSLARTRASIHTFTHARAHTHHRFTITVSLTITSSVTLHARVKITDRTLGRVAILGLVSGLNLGLGLGLPIGRWVGQ